MSAAGTSPAVIDVSAEDLPLHCPTAAMQAWSSHPRVFLRLAPVAGRSGLEARCPYCGTRYHFAGELPKGH